MTKGKEAKAVPVVVFQKPGQNSLLPTPRPSESFSARHQPTAWPQINPPD